MHGFSIQLQDFIACFEREKILLLLDCTVSYVIHALKRSLAKNGCRCKSHLWLVSASICLSVPFFGKWEKGEKRDSHLLVAFHQQQQLHQERWF